MLSLSKYLLKPPWQRWAIRSVWRIAAISCQDISVEEKPGNGKRKAAYLE